LPTASIILEDNHGSVSGTGAFDLSPDDTRIYLGSGQVLRTSDFSQIGSVGGGVPAVSDDGALVYMGASSEIQIWRTDTYLQVASVAVPGSVEQLILVEDKGYIAVLTGSSVVAVPIP